MSSKRKPAPRGERKAPKNPAPESVPTPEQEARHFVEGLLIRSEAAERVDGKLPPGATHEIVTDEEGHARPVRRRFSTH